MIEQEFTGETLMPIGKYKGQKLKTLSNGYLTALYDSGFARGALKGYIIKNIRLVEISEELKQKEIEKTIAAQSDQKQVKEVQALRDSDRMPFGIHKGLYMAHVPADYLIWIYDKGKCTMPVKLYIDNNMDVLRGESNKNLKR